MALAFLNEIGNGFLRLWLNPVFYMTFFLSITLAFQRVKKERLYFHSRVYDVVSDLYHSFIPGLLFSVILNVLFIGFGFVLAEGIIVLLMASTLLLSITFQPRFLSPAVVIFLTAIAIVFYRSWEGQTDGLNQWISDASFDSLPHLYLLMIVFLLIEALFIIFQAKRQPSPRRVIGKRGKVVGGFETNRVWFVPTFLLIPGIGIERIDWWPLLGSENSFAFMLVPFLIGYHKFQTHDLPERALKRDGLRLMVITFVFLPIAVLTILFKWLTVAFVGMALLCFMRLLLYVMERKWNEGKKEFFTLRNQGLQILATIPKTPAAQMNVKVGEVIQRVNGIKVNRASQFYEALQMNPTFFKLEIVDENGELRFEQGAFYANEHYLLGFLFVDEVRSRYNDVEEA